MGYNTACLVLNDTLHEIAADPYVGQGISDAILTANRLGGYGPHAFMALPSQHADVAQIVVVAGNSISALGYGHWQDSPETLLRKLADQHGFRLARKPARKVPA